MVRFFGCKPGEMYRASAGATRRVVTLDLRDVSPEAEGLSAQFSGSTAVLSDAPASPATLWVVWHKGERSTFHGIGRPMGTDPVGTSVDPHELVWDAESSSGGADIWAAVLRLAPGSEPVNLLLSGYDGRSGWRVVTFSASGETTTMSLSDWRATAAAPVAL